MFTVLITTLAMMMLYGLVWHNQPGRTTDSPPIDKEPLDKSKTP